MKLKCVENTYESFGPGNDGTKFTAQITVGKEYVGQLIFGKMIVHGEFLDHGVDEKLVFVCMSDNGVWASYRPSWFTVI